MRAILLLFLLCTFEPLKSQTVRNARAVLQDGKMIVEYTLDHPTNNTKVDLFVQNQGYGKIKVTKAEGDIGKHIFNGQNKRIVWDWENRYNKLNNARLHLEAKGKYAANRRSVDMELLTLGYDLSYSSLIASAIDLGFNFKNSNVWGFGVAFIGYPFYETTLYSSGVDVQSLGKAYLSGKWGNPRTNFHARFGPIIGKNIGADLSVGVRQRLFAGLSAVGRIGSFGLNDGWGGPGIYVMGTISYSWTMKERITIPIQNNEFPRKPSDEQEIVQNNTTDNSSTNSKVQSVLWIHPNTDEMPALITVEESLFPIKVKVLSPYRTIKSDYKIYLNDQIFEGNRAEQGSLTGQTYSAIVKLQPGKNQIEVECRGKKSKPIFVVYSTEKPSLHLISIGVQQPDLKYTQKDAADLAALYQLYKSQDLFSESNVRTLLGEQATAGEVRGIFEEYKTLFELGEISSNDVLMIFLSSHGFLQDGSFYIQGSDYSPVRRTTTSVSYTEMLEHLDKIQCKKVLFIDACHSGGARTSSADLNEALKRLSQSQSGLYAMASSSGSELSYEDPIWQNGAFSEAILAGLNGEADGKGRNGKLDQIIYLDELYSYVRTKVPQMVKTIKNDSQTPTIFHNDLGDIPIFIKK